MDSEVCRLDISVDVVSSVDLLDSCQHLLCNVKNGSVLLGWIGKLVEVLFHAMFEILHD
jgi:hypothetical protein